MKTLLNKTLVTAAIASLTFLAQAAQAAETYLAPGAIVTPVASPFPSDFSAMTPLASQSSTVTAAGDAFTGTFTSEVYANTASAADAMNPGFTLGMAVLDFVYQFTNAPTSLTSVARLSLFNLAPDSIPNQLSIIAWQQSGDPDGAGSLFVNGQKGSDHAERSTNGRSVAFNYGTVSMSDRIDPGQSSFAILLRVNTSHYSSGYFTAIDGSAAVARAYIPAPPVPEPENYALILGGLTAIAFVVRRRTLD